jgi:hypothetical protein
MAGGGSGGVIDVLHPDPERSEGRDLAHVLPEPGRGPTCTEKVAPLRFAQGRDEELAQDDRDATTLPLTALDRPFV